MTVDGPGAGPGILTQSGQVSFHQQQSGGEGGGKTGTRYVYGSIYLA